VLRRWSALSALQRLHCEKGGSQESAHVSSRRVCLARPGLRVQVGIATNPERNTDRMIIVGGSPDVRCSAFRTLCSCTMPRSTVASQLLGLLLMQCRTRGTCSTRTTAVVHLLAQPSRRCACPKDRRKTLTDVHPRSHTSSPQVARCGTSPHTVSLSTRRLSGFRRFRCVLEGPWHAMRWLMSGLDM
jgi:hypothetical protein